MKRLMLAGFAVLGLMACGTNKPDAPGAEQTATSGKGSSNRTLASGATIDVTTARTITSRSSGAGETLATTVDTDVLTSGGRVAIPAGSALELTITEITPARNKSQEDGTLVLQVTGVTVRGKGYPINAEVTSVAHTLKGRGVTTGEVEKVAVGAAIGAVAGQIIGKNTKGTVIGAAVGAAGGTVVAIQTASRDVVVSAGTPVLVTLTGPLTVASE